MATYSVATLTISKAAYDEIRGRLRRANYGHVFLDDGTIDMNGIGLVREVTEVDKAVKKKR